MTRPNVHVTVSGVKNPSTGYKTILLKKGTHLGEQLTEPNTRYVVRGVFEIGVNPIVHPVNFTDGGTMIIEDVTYYWLFIVSSQDNFHITLIDDTVFFVTRMPDAILPTREVTLNKGEIVHLASPVLGLHPRAYMDEENGIQVPTNCILDFDGGSFQNGFIELNNAKVTPTYNSLLNDTLTVYGVPALGTMYFQKGKPTWSDSTRWIDANGYSPALSKGTTDERPIGKHEVETEEGVTIVGDLLPEDAGFKYFDVDLAQPIYTSSIDDTTGEVVWVDAAGEPIAENNE